MRKNDKSDFINYVRTDLKRGMTKNIIKYILYVTFLIITLIVFDKMVESGMNAGKIADKPGVYDYWIYLFAGNNAFNSQQGNSFSFQPIWLMMTTMPAFIVYSYAAADIEGIGQQFLFRVKDKRKWWISKCIWNMCSVIMLHVLMFITIFLFAIKNYKAVNEIFVIHSDVCSEISEIAMNQKINVIIMIIIAPLVIGIGVSLIQMMLSLIYNPAISFLIIIVMNVLSSFFETHVLPNEYTMIIRWSSRWNQGNVPVIGILIGVILAIGGLIIGDMYFQRMDIIERNKS